MNEINHELWDNIFEPQRYEDIDVVTLKELQEKIKDVEKYVSVMQQDFDYICGKIFKTPIRREKPEEGISVQNNIASTTRREQLDEKKMMMIESTPSEIDDEKNKLMKKYLQFLEIMYQDEIIRIKALISDYWGRHYRNAQKVQLAVQGEYFTNIISLFNNLLQCEDEVLKFKIEREEVRTKMIPVHVELINISRKIDHDMCKLLMDNRYLQFVETMRQKEVKRILFQFEAYCAMYRIPNKEKDVMIYQAFILERIEKLKNILGLSGQAMEFNLQIEREVTNTKTNNSGTSKMSSNADNSYMAEFCTCNQVTRVEEEAYNLKNTLLRINYKNLQHIATMHQTVIDTVYHKLKKYCNDYCFDYCTDDCNNVLSDINEEGLTRDNENLRSFAVARESSFNDIYNELKMYCGKYDMPNENVTIVMHTESYDYHMKIYTEENNLKKSNECYAFVAMMHLEKMRELLYFFEMFRNRFCECTIEKITKTDSFLQQKEYVTNEISLIKNQIGIQKGLLDYFAQIYQIKLR